MRADVISLAAHFTVATLFSHKLEAGKLGGVLDSVGFG
jgi:hypothetical protein